MLALRTALGLKPEVVFFLTDADLMTNNDVNEILAEVRRQPDPVPSSSAAAPTSACRPRSAAWPPPPAAPTATST